jgi:PKD repeat protein
MTVRAVGALTVLGALLAIVPGPAAAATTPVKVLPTADARVAEALPTSNFGSGQKLMTAGDAGARMESVLRFDLSGVKGTITNVTLKLYVTTDGTVDGPDVLPAAGGWTENGVTWTTRPASTGPAVGHIGAAVPGTWVSVNVTPIAAGGGELDVLLRQAGGDSVTFYSRQGANPPRLLVTTGDPVVLAAGDIACAPGAAVTPTACHQSATAELIRTAPALTRVLPLGDEQYDTGALADFLGPGAYDATWGVAKPITAPVPGNHEYHVAGAPGYFGYFGALAGAADKGYYSFDLGAWHLIALNADIPVGVGSAEEGWLRADLAATKQPCVLAYWHEPRFSSGYHGDATWTGTLWKDLYAARADVVLNGHDHDYERFAPQTPAGAADPAGIREFVVGTGGGAQEPLGVPQPNSEVLDATTFGVLQLTLHDGGYDWRFLPEAGRTFSDAGSATCHNSPPHAALSVTPASGPAPLTVTADASASTDPDRSGIATYSFDFGDGSGKSPQQAQPTATHVYAAAGTYTVTVVVTDRSGLTSSATAKVTVGGNLVLNPGFEVDTQGWNTSGSAPGVVLATAAGGHSGDRAAVLTNTGTVAGTCTLNDSPNWVTTTTAATYTAGLWVRADTPGAMLRLRLREYSGALLSGTAYVRVALTTAWQLVTVSYASLAPGASTLDFNADVVNAAPGNCFYADDATIVAG